MLSFRDQPIDQCVCTPKLEAAFVNRAPVHPLSAHQALERVEQLLNCPACHVVNHIPADPTLIARRDPSFLRVLERADLNLPDGMGVVWACRQMGFALEERVYGPDFMMMVCSWGIGRNLRHYFYGGTPLVLERLTENLTARFPALQIAGSYSPPFRELSDDEMSGVIEAINSSGADVVWVGIGTPKQQVFADKVRSSLDAKVVFTVGAAFDFLSGAKRQAPKWMQDRGLEWLFRLKTEPRRLARRYIIGVPHFAFSVKKDLRSNRRTFGHSKASGVVLLVGPDGSGKSTVVAELSKIAAQNSVEFHSAHHRPMVLAKGRSDGPVTNPQGQIPRGKLPSAVKLLVVFADSVIGSWTSWKRGGRSGVVVVERGWFDMVVDPRRYRLPRSLSPVTSAMGRMIPRADLAVLLTGSPESIQSRKSEISLDETKRQIEIWNELAPRSAKRVLVVDTTTTGPDETANRVWQALSRPEEMERWRSVPLTPSRLGLRHAGADVSSLAIYTPQRARARLVHPVASSLTSMHIGSTSQLPSGLQPLIERLDFQASGISAMRSSQKDRWIIGVAREGKLFAVIKAGDLADEGLRREASLLGQIASGKNFRVPELIWSGEVDGYFGLATGAVHQEKEKTTIALNEVAEICRELVTGVGDLGPIVHGDLTPWNLIASRNGMVAIDWEQWRPVKDPLFDLTYYIIRSAALLSRYKPQQVLDLLTSPGSPGWTHLESIGEDPHESTDLIRSHLMTFEKSSRLKVRRFSVELLRLIG